MDGCSYLHLEGLPRLPASSLRVAADAAAAAAQHHRPLLTQPTQPQLRPPQPPPPRPRPWRLRSACGSLRPRPCTADRAARGRRARGRGPAPSATRGCSCPRDARESTPARTHARTRNRTRRDITKQKKRVWGVGTKRKLNNKQRFRNGRHPPAAARPFSVAPTSPRRMTASVESEGSSASKAKSSQRR